MELAPDDSKDSTPEVAPADRDEVELLEQGRALLRAQKLDPAADKLAMALESAYVLALPHRPLLPRRYAVWRGDAPVPRRPLLPRRAARQATPRALQLTLRSARATAWSSSATSWTRGAGSTTTTTATRS